MQKTITIDENLYSALSEHVGSEEVDRYVEDLIRQRVADLDDWPSDEELEASYREKAANEESEREAREWADGLIGDSLPSVI